MPTYDRLAGSTSVSLNVFIFDPATGLPDNTVVFNTSGLVLNYRRTGAANVAITTVTLAALTTAWASGGFILMGNGVYRLDVPDAAFAAGVNGVTIHGTLTSRVIIGSFVNLVAYNPFDAVRLGLTALPNVASGSAGAIPTTGTGANQLSVTSGTVALSTTTEQQIDDIDSNLATYLLGFATFGTVNDGSPTQSGFTVSAEFSDVNDHYNGLRIYILSGDQKGRRATITDQVVRALTLGSGLTAAPENGAVVAIMS